MSKIKILWVDDEIDLLKIQILFLEEKGYQVFSANNGNDALDLIEQENFDLILLDENMPGISGLDLLPRFKKIAPSTPVVMVTKNEEEDIMEEAVGSNISDYLLKPVKPNHIILAIKKHVEKERLVTEKTHSKYQKQFNKINTDISLASCFQDWVNIYKELIYWELKLHKSVGRTMDEVLIRQKNDANIEFCKFIKTNYQNWFKEDVEDKPLMPQDFFRKKVIPLTDRQEQVFVIMIDNLRFDQWKAIEPMINRYMQTEEEEAWMSILPTATQYARNAFFFGLMPVEIQNRYPDLWKNDEQAGGKNEHEEKLLQILFERYRRKIHFNYAKVLNNRMGEKLNESLSDMLQKQLNVVIYNSIDIFSHAKTDTKIIQELAGDDAAYRDLIVTWFEHSPLLALIKELAKQKITTFITTDHGAININNPVKVIGTKDLTTNLRYKQGKTMQYDSRRVFEIKKPETVGLPAASMNSSYIFAYNNDFFAYPNNFNHYVKYYRNTFQHGGISMEEMILPYITLKSK